MQVIVNGESIELAEGLSVSALLAQYKLKPEGVVVELNLEVPAKARYGELVLKAGDKVEIVKFMGGG